MRKPVLSFTVALAAVLLPGALRAAPAALFVSTYGSDTNPGTRQKPFASLEKARDAVRGLRSGGPVTVTIRGGVYRITKTLTLGLEDSGTAAAPVVWEAASGENVRFVGGARLTKFGPVGEAVRERLAPEARAHVVAVDLRAAGVTDFGSVKPGVSRAEVFFDNRYLRLARYPNEGWVRIAAIPEGAATARPAPNPNLPEWGRYEGPFVYSDPRPERWAKNPDVWVHGYWFHDWSDEYQQVQRFDLERKELWPKPPYHGYGYKKDQRYYYLNVLEELDSPGEWYLDRESGILYLWPPMPVEKAEVIFPELKTPMLLLKDGQYIQWRGITFEASRAGAVQIVDGKHNEITGCTVRNVGDTAISVTGGMNHSVKSCDIYEVGATGIVIKGGDRKTLERSDHVVDNCHIHHFGRVQPTYRPGIQIGGVGNTISHCYIHDAPHAGILFDGNEHVIEYSEITRIAQETGDVGAIYGAFDWSYMGNIVRYNYFHDIHGPGSLGCFTIYPDLPVGGIHLYGNVFDDVDQIFHTNSGRGMVIENNIFYHARRGINFSAWQDMAKFKPGGNWQMVERVAAVNYDKPPYSTRYPVLARLAEDFAKGEDQVWERALPKDNIVRRNVSWGDSWFLALGPAKVPLDIVKVENNLIGDPIVFRGSPTGDGKSADYGTASEQIREIFGRSGNVIRAGDPGFVDAAGGDLSLKPSSPAWKLGFERIPFDTMGLQIDSYRRHLPAAAPRITTTPQVFFGGLEVRIKPAARGPKSLIRFTLDGSEPSTGSPVYKAPIRLKETATVKAAAWPVNDSDRDRSQTVSASFRAARLGPGGGVFLSELPEEEYAGYYSELIKDHANENKPIRLGGQIFDHGLITHPSASPAGGKSYVTYRLSGGLAGAHLFTARIGIEDQAPRDKPGLGTAAFAVEIERNGKWVRVLETPVMKAGGSPVDVLIDLTGATRLRLIATDGGDGNAWDHAVWADAKIQ